MGSRDLTGRGPEMFVRLRVSDCSDGLSCIFPLGSSRPLRESVLLGPSCFVVRELAVAG